MSRCEVRELIDLASTQLATNPAPTARYSYTYLLPMCGEMRGLGVGQHDNQGRVGGVSKVREMYVHNLRQNEKCMRTV